MQKDRLEGERQGQRTDKVNQERKESPTAKGSAKEKQEAGKEAGADADGGTSIPMAGLVRAGHKLTYIWGWG